MSIVEQAKAELERINFGEEDTAAMVAILERFFEQWDSGAAVAYVAPILMRCISGQPLSPLTGADDEWHDPMGDGLMLQNVRCGSVFKDYRNADGELAPGGTELIHDIDAPDPFAPITFPYDPATSAPAVPVLVFDAPKPSADLQWTEEDLRREMARPGTIEHLFSPEIDRAIADGIKAEWYKGDKPEDK